ncbi:beta-lactamase regulating signal transducer with metallopeptidase domain [Pseudoduganella flava]|uniref:Beta-lactamase regulating signal transducer with metallopeptidase domain n=1 Tax=Pseudoduganella flava TaxID=871742 RepID=A0A562Q342_9BURK|nr:M56 family metallopeptidase [Pseudoduganella flava]QGZ41199.1 peptidase M56 [Pseudoduganella flava]TWI51131.1 beta-lactamase regulating signal transducer with metallopeptidase domain [Pseudoduganella flava]
MSALFEMLVPAIGWSLLHFVWQGLLIGWAAALALHLLRNARPQARYAVACAALLLCAALPVASIVWRVYEAVQAGYSMPVPVDPLLDAVRAGAIPGANVSVVDADQLTSFEYLLRGQLPWLVLLWALGAALMTLRLSLGLQWVRRRTQLGHYTPNAPWQRRLDALALRFGITRPIRLGVSGEDLEGPMTAGCWRPIVLLPAALVTGMPPHLLEALLAHELAHIRRHDYLVNLVQSAIEILLFYHPSVWMLSKRIRIEREQIADDLAASVLGEPRRLALALSELDKFQFSTSHFAPAAHGGDLMSRIKRLVRPDSQPLSWKIAAPLLGLCTACVMLYAHARPDGADTPAAPTQPRAAATQQAAAEAAAAHEDAGRAAFEAAKAAVEAGSDAAAAAKAAAEAARHAKHAGQPMPRPPQPPAPPAPPKPPAPPAPLAIAPAAALPAPPAAPAAPEMALPAPPAPPAPPALDLDGHTFQVPAAGASYAIVVAGKDRMKVSALDTRDAKDVQRLKDTVKGDFIWFRRDGKAYVVNDPALLAQVRGAWAPTEKLGAEMERQGQAMNEQGSKMQVIGEQIGKTMAAAFNDDSMRGTERQINALGMTLDVLARRMERLAERMESAPTEAQRASISRQMQAVQMQIEPVQKQMANLTEKFTQAHRKADVDHEPARALQARIEELSKPMHEMGMKMGKLAAEQSRLSRDADRTTRALIDEALRKGQAKEVAARQG